MEIEYDKENPLQEEIQIESNLNLDFDLIEEVEREDNPPEDLDLGTNENVYRSVHKLEYFNSKNLLFILEYLRTCISNQNIVASEEELIKVTKNFWKLRHFALSADFTSNCCQTIYRCSSYLEEIKVGRVYAYTSSLHSKATKHAGLQNFNRWIRSALASEFYWDIDIANAHSSILLGILEAFEIIKPEYLSMLVRERDEIVYSLAMLSDHGELQEKKAASKTLLTILLYGGSIKNAWKNLKFSRDYHMMILSTSGFELTNFSTEMNKIYDLIWDSTVLDQHYLYLQHLKVHPRITNELDLNKRKRTYLSLFLQTEERLLLCWIEKFMKKNDRAMDCYIHDGGLVRKFASPKKLNVKPSVSFDPQDLFLVEELENYCWEKQFPLNLLNECEDFLVSKEPIKYQHIKLAVKNFESNWQQNIKFNVPRVPNFLRKTYDELKYYYEKVHSLFQVETSGNFWFNGDVFEPRIISGVIKENKYYTSVVHIEYQNQKRSGLTRSPSRSRSQSPIHSLVSQTSAAINSSLGNNQDGMEIHHDFWNTYKKDTNRRQIRKVLFCKEEKNISQLKEPTEGMANEKRIKRAYCVLYEDMYSFDVMKNEKFSSCRHLYEVFLVDTKSTEESKKQIVILKHGNEERSVLLTLFKKSLSYDEKIVDLEGAYDFLNHIYLLCNKKEADFIYVIKYIAKILQHPTVKEEGCGLILYSDKEGVGKSIAATMILDLIAPFGKETHEAKDVFGQFSILQDNCIILHLEDTDASEMHQFSSHFKNRLTAKTLTVERKHENKVTKLNLCRYLITTNDLDGLPIGENDRRWAIINCEALLLGDTEYFKKLNLVWSNHANRIATFKFLMSLDLGAFSCEKDKPANSLLKEMKSKKMSQIKRFMIGVSFWLNDHIKQTFTQRGLDFSKLYERKVNLKDLSHHQKELNTAFWIASADLFTCFCHWLNTDSTAKSQSDYTLQTFSTEVRRILFQMSSQLDKLGKACLPVCIKEWIMEAQNYGLENQENIIQFDTLLQSSRINNCQDENRRGKKVHKGDKKKTNYSLKNRSSKTNNAHQDLQYQENSFGHEKEKEFEQIFTSDNDSASFGMQHKKVKKS
jgi:hypothetical protein